MRYLIYKHWLSPGQRERWKAARYVRRHGYIYVQGTITNLERALYGYNYATHYARADARNTAIGTFTDLKYVSLHDDEWWAAFRCPYDGRSGPAY